MSLTRRSLLGATVALALAGCRSRRGRPAGRPAGVALADRSAIESAAELERSLIAGYDTAIEQLDAVAAGRLSRARERHLAHLVALDDAAGRHSPVTAPTPDGAPSALTAALTASAGSLQSAAVQAESGAVAALLASVAAEHAADAALASRPSP